MKGSRNRVDDYRAYWNSPLWSKTSFEDPDPELVKAKNRYTATVDKKEVPVKYFYREIDEYPLIGEKGCRVVAVYDEIDDLVKGVVFVSIESSEIGKLVERPKSEVATLELSMYPSDSDME
jgi:hypothetical protein